MKGIKYADWSCGRNGLEVLFDNVSKHSITFSANADNGKSPTVGYLINYICDNLIKDPRKELFILDGAVYVI